MHKAVTYVEEVPLACPECGDSGIVYVEDLAVWCDCPAGLRSQKVGA